MTVRRGAEWGEVGRLADDGVVVSSDAEARRVVTEARRAKRPVPELGLLAGDLARTCGVGAAVASSPDVRAGELKRGEGRRLPVDLGSVLVDGVLHWFTAHLLARRRFWRGPLLAVMNAEFFGDWDVAPRGHPGDGRLDVLEVTMTMAERVEAWRRLRTGTHVPHPRIAERRITAAQFDLAPKTSVWLDGDLVGTDVSSLSVRIEPDALLVVV